MLFLNIGSVAALGIIWKKKNEKLRILVPSKISLDLETFLTISIISWQPTSLVEEESTFYADHFVSKQINFQDTTMEEDDNTWEIVIQNADFFSRQNIKYQLCQLW